MDGIKEGSKTRGQRRWKELKKVVKQEDREGGWN